MYPFSHYHARKNGIDSDLGPLCGSQALHKMKTGRFGDAVAHTTSYDGDSLMMISAGL
jgi:hypothetical protein